MIYYHVSPRPDLTSIDPAYSKGKYPSVWVCNELRLWWAIAHVGSWQRARWMYVYEVEVGADAEYLLKRSGRDGVWRCNIRLKVSRIEWRGKKRHNVES